METPQAPESVRATLRKVLALAQTGADGERSAAQQTLDRRPMKSIFALYVCLALGALSSAATFTIEVGGKQCGRLTTESHSSGKATYQSTKEQCVPGVSYPDGGGGMITDGVRVSIVCIATGFRYEIHTYEIVGWQSFGNYNSCPAVHHEVYSGYAEVAVTAGGVSIRKAGDGPEGEAPQSKPSP